MPFESNVFINCPFDPDYESLLRPIIFCLMFLGFQPRIALERLNSGEPRVDKIIELIESCRFAIHDLSRLKAKKKGEFYRLNMPFELGLDVGCRLFKPGRWAEKKCLVLEAERYRFQAAISDISNSDIVVHQNNPELALSGVRNWIAVEAGIRPPGSGAVWNKFVDFMAQNYDNLKARSYSDEEIATQPIPELIQSIGDWLSHSSVEHDS